MKTGFLLVAHKPLASAFNSVAEEIFAGLEAVEAGDIDSDEDRQLQQEQLEKAWNAIDADQKVVLVDVFAIFFFCKRKKLRMHRSVEPPSSDETPLLQKSASGSIVGEGF